MPIRLASEVLQGIVWDPAPWGLRWGAHVRKKTIGQNGMGQSPESAGKCSLPLPFRRFRSSSGLSTRPLLALPARFRLFPADSRLFPMPTLVLSARSRPFPSHSGLSARPPLALPARSRLFPADSRLSPMPTLALPEASSNRFLADVSNTPWGRFPYRILNAVFAHHTGTLRFRKRSVPV